VLAGAGAILASRGVRYGRDGDLMAAPPRLRPALRRVGRFGAVTRGIMFLLPGVVLVVEAWAYRDGSFGRVSERVRAALEQPWGRALLLVAAVGLAAFAAYELAAAAYRREPVEPAAATAAAGTPLRPWWTVAAILLGAGAGLCGLLIVLGHALEALDPASGRNTDLAVAAWFADHRTPVLNQLSAAATATATPMACLTVTAVTAVLLTSWHGRWRPSVALVLAVAGQLLISVLVTAAVDRPRPPVPQLEPASAVSGFPSVPTGAAVTLYGCVAVIALSELRWYRRPGAALAAGIVAVPLVVGLSELYRGIHFPSDVLAGAAAGAAWLAVVVAVVLNPRRSPGPTPAPVAGRRAGVQP
jgi:membrane-associated phospholipid phosphatase